MSFGGVNTFQQYSDDFGVGHNGVRVSFNYFDGIPEPSVLNALASNDLRLIFKSLLKRDETTKEKALGDLLKLIEDFPAQKYLFENDIFFLCWSQVYSKLLVSESKGIRISAHVITSKLIKLLNKRISKFLKDLIPLLLMGVCDTDSSVSKASIRHLDDVFDGDTKKIDSLWVVFQEYILDVVSELVIKENEETISDERFVGKEDSQLRFNRLITSAVYLLTQLTNSNKFDQKESANVYHSILTTERLWKLLSLKNIHFLKSYEAVLRLQQLLFRDAYLTTHKDVLKLSTKRLLKSLSQVNSKNVLKFGPLTGSILSTLTMLDDYKEGRIWTYDKSSKEKLLGFLKIASKTPFPGFFNSMFAFYDKTQKHQLLDVKQDWSPIWRGSIKAMNERPFFGRFGAELLAEVWNNYKKFVKSVDDTEMYEMAEEDVLETLRSVKQLQGLSDLKEDLKDLVKPERLGIEVKRILAKEEDSSPLLRNSLSLLSAGTENQKQLRELANYMLEQLSDCQAGFSARDLQIISIYDYFVKEDVKCLSHEVSRFVYEVPTWIEVGTYDRLARIIVDYSKSTFVQSSDDFISIMDDFLTAALSAGIPSSKIASTLNELDDKSSKAVLLAPAVQDFITSYIEAYEFDDEGALFEGRIISRNHVCQLYERAVKKNNMAIFIQYLPHLGKHSLEAALEIPELISNHLFNIPATGTEKFYRLIVPFTQCNIKITKNLANAILSHARKAGPNSSGSLHLKYAADLITSKRENFSFFLPTDIAAEFCENVPFVDSRLSLLSTLGSNAHLVEVSSDRLDLHQIEQFVKYCLFLDSLITRVGASLDNKLRVFLTMAAELGEDYNCLSDSPIEEFHDFTNTLFRSQFSKLSFERITEIITGASTENDERSALTQDLIADTQSSTLSFYRLRILHKLLQNEIDDVSAITFTRVFPAIERYIVSIIRGKQTSCHSYLMAATLLSAMEKFNELDLFTKVRNLLASECVGAKGEEVIKRSHKLIILLNNLLKFWDQSNSMIPVAPQRLNMMLGSVRQWLDSDIAFEKEFSTIRLALLRLCTLLAQNSSVENNSSLLYEVSTRLLNDSLAMCQLEETEYVLELRILCLNLYDRLSGGSNGLPSEDFEDLQTSLIELSLIDWQAEGNNQISSIFYGKLFKAMNNCPLKKLLEYYSQFFESFMGSDSSKNVNRTRVLLVQLEKLVIEKQKDAFIEFEFRKKQESLSKDSQVDEEEDESPSIHDEFKLPLELIEKLELEVPQEYLESENELVFLKYLWYWNLTFCYFREASYDLRQLFIDQLKSKDLISGFFDFIADQIDLNDTKFWLEAGADAILTYDVSATDFSPYREEAYAECKRLLGHSMYRLFVNVGSLSSNWWLNIKDRSLQSKIEKYVSQFISPILIDKELEDVTNKMDKLKSNDDALTIKINKVTNEVKASYLIDEQKLELSFKLPSNYPLTNVQVIGVSRVGISEQKWKQWIMSAQRVITGMNGSVMDSMELLTRNINLQFSGFEECAICYSILHAVDRKLPTKTCPTCSNKFHGACLYKWFRSSGNNTCPLCRSEIPFRR